jgi:predicted CXXCH cytochrome family protein
MSTQGYLGINATLETPGLAPASCVACHDPHDATNDYQLRESSQTEMCAQCHDAPPRHLNYALFIEGPHEKAGLECTSCHGQGTRLRRGSVSDWFNHTFGIYETYYPYNQTDPTVCSSCHDQTWATTQLDIIQGTVGELVANVSKAIVSAQSAITMANQTSGIDSTKVDQARTQLADAESWVTYVERDGSGGLHNPEQTYQVLGEAWRLANEVEALMRDAQQQALTGDLSNLADQLAISQTLLYAGAFGAIIAGIVIGMIVGRRW